MKNCRQSTDMKVKSILITGGLALALTAQSAFGLSDFVSQIPNGSIFSCATCHTSGFGWNPFGQDFKDINRTWSATLAGLDSDGDGFTNGQELGDPNGTGTPAPDAWVSNPGDPSSNPVPPRPPCTIIKSFGVLSKVTGLKPRAPLVQGPDGTLYGTASTGDGYGTVFKLQPDGTGFAVLKCFTNSVEGAYPCAGLVLSGDTLYGTTYGTARYVGGSGKGTVFKVNTDGTDFTVLKSFTGSDGASPAAGLILSGDTLYGTTSSGGNNDKGTVFKMNTDGTGYTVLKSFTGSNGAHPAAALVLSRGALYGTTASGGSSNKGTVFRLDANGRGYTVLKSFTGSDGALPRAGLVFSGGTLYGTTYSGGDSNQGTVFKVNTNGTDYAVLKSLSLTSRDGISPWAGLVLSGSTLYGTTYGSSTVFKVNTDGTGFSVLKKLNGMSQAGLLLSGDTLYGTTESGGTLGNGTVFKVNTDGTGHTVLKNFTLSDGALPEAGLALSGDTLYGTTYVGGSSNRGTVFKVNTNGTGYTVLKNFTGSDGELPNARLVLSGSTLYGTAGTVFKMNTDGSGYTVLKNVFSDAGLVLSRRTLYGTSANGGSSNAGAVFKVNINGSGYTVLKSFTGSEGRWPYAGLVLYDGTLYGTTRAGGSSDYGTVFKVNTDCSGFSVLKHFTGSDGAQPWAGLVLSGGTLYGTTKYGGISDYGTLFKVNTDGSGFSVLKYFTGSDGMGPVNNLVLSGETLYGTTHNTACDYTRDNGMVFKVNTDGTGYTVLKSFIGSPDGWGPSELILSGETLYGTTVLGGNLNNGAVFRIDLAGGMAPAIDSQPQSQVNMVDSTAIFSVTAIGTDPLTFQWLKDDVNLADGVQSSGATISGTNTTDLTITDVQMSDAGDYTVVVTNPYGSVTSSVAALTVQLNDAFESARRHWAPPATPGLVEQQRLFAKLRHVQTVPKGRIGPSITTLPTGRPYEIGLDCDLANSEIIKSVPNWKRSIFRATPLYREVQEDGILETAVTTNWMTGD